MLFVINLLHYYDPLLLNNREDKIKKKNKHKAQLEDQLNERAGIKKLNLKGKNEIERFRVQRFFSDNSVILFYTSFIYLAMFTAVFDIKPVANFMNSYYYKSNEKINEHSIVGRHRNILLTDEFFMLLYRLKCGLMEQDLANRFNCHLFYY